MEQNSAGVREQMIAGGGALFARQGYAATTMRGVVAEAGTPWGSVHHYFPGGKEQLALAAIELGDRTVRSMMSECLTRSSTSADAVRQYFEEAGGMLAASGWDQGCPIATVALEVASTDTAAAAACRKAMTAWVTLWADALKASGVDDERAVELGTLVVLNMEGALLLSRITRSVRPLQLAAESTAVLVGLG